MSGQTKIMRALYLALAWLFLQLLLSVDYPAPWSPLRHLLRPSLDVWGLLLIVSVWACVRASYTPRVYVPLILAFVFLRLFRLGDVLMPVYFYRPFNLYMDTRYVPDLLHLLYHSFTWSQRAMYGLAAALLSAALLIGIWKSFYLAFEAFAMPRCRRAFWVLTALQALLMGVYLQGGLPPSRWGPPGTSCTPRLIEEAAFIAKIGEIKRQGLSAVEMASARIPPYTSPLADLHQANVYLFIVESYGQTLFADPRHASRFLPVMAHIESDLAGSGYHVCSQFINSPTFGGGSWLAFGTLETGVWAPDQLRYNFVLNSDVRPLADYFNRAGYRTVSVMPGTTMPWPEGRFFGYSNAYYSKDLQYQGPAYSWSPMPDQFVLARIHTQEVAHRPEGLFVRYVLTSTHAPFNRQPPYIENWDRLGRGEVYGRLAPITFAVNWPDLSHATEAYLAAMTYEWTVLKEYLTAFVNHNALVIVVGDHQPNAQVTGPDQPSWVPIHVISRDTDLIEPFRRMGYTTGLVPRRPPPYPGMDDFLSAFLAAFSR